MYGMYEKSLEASATLVPVWKLGVSKRARHFEMPRFAYSELQKLDQTLFMTQ